jgi:hypothetical protein
MQLPIDVYMDRFNSNIRRISLELGVAEQKIRNRSRKHGSELLVSIDEDFKLTKLEIIHREVFERA